MKRAVIVASIGAAVILGSLSVASRAASISRSLSTGNDFTQDYLAARAWIDGRDPYTPVVDLHRDHFGPSVGTGFLPDGHRSPHPPAVLLVVAPVALASYQAARIMWLLLMAGLTVSSVTFLGRHLGWSGPRAAAVGFGVLALPIMQTDLILGQLNAIVLAGLIVAGISFERGRSARAGIALGLISALRLFPLFLVVVLVALRRWRALAWTGASFVGATVVGLVALGPGATSTFVREISPENLSNWRAAPHNLSWLSVPARWLTPSRWFPDRPDLPVLAALLAGVILVAIVVGAWLAARQAGFWAAVPWMLMASPIVWDHYGLALVPVAFVLVARGSGEGVWRPIALLLFAVVFVGHPRSLGHPDAATTWSQLFGWALPAYTIAALGVWLTNDGPLRRSDPRVGAGR